MYSKSPLQPVSRATVYGILVWLIPFLVSIPFHDQSGQLVTDVFLFKSVMIVVSSCVGSLLMALHLRRLDGRFLAHGLLAGAIWLAVNWGLDCLILLPLSGMDFEYYFLRTGMGYVSMLFVGGAIGLALQTSPHGQTTPVRV